MFDPIWSWAIVGVALIALELVTGTFYIMCFGISSLLVAGASGVFSLSLNPQLALFVFFSLITLGLWHFGYKGKKSEFLIGQSTDESIGKIGQVSEVGENSRIMVSFTFPVMGARTWLALSEEKLELGNEIKVVSIEGNYLKVEKTQK